MRAGLRTGLASSPIACEYAKMYIKAQNDLREVELPCQNMLYVRGKGSKSRFRVEDVYRGSAAQKVILKKSKVVKVWRILTSFRIFFFGCRYACIFFFFENGINAYIFLIRHLLFESQWTLIQ